MTGTIVQINVSPGGLPKRPVPEAMLTAMGIEGDSWAHPRIHGGENKAVLLMDSETIDELAARGFPVVYGAMGENLTTRGLDRRQLRLLQQIRVGDALIELTGIRTPCATLDVYGPELKREIFDELVKAGDPASPRWGMSGFYARVIRPARIRPGDPVSVVATLA